MNNTSDKLTTVVTDEPSTLRFSYLSDIVWYNVLKAIKLQYSFHRITNQVQKLRITNQQPVSTLFQAGEYVIIQLILFKKFFFAAIKGSI